jgi:hypothetical protein
MISDSRKAQRNSFAHYRAALIFSNSPAAQREPVEQPTSALGGVEPNRPDSLQRLTANVRAGLHGFHPPRPAPL